MSYGSLLYRMKRLIGGSTANSEIYKNFTLTYRRDLCQIQYEPHELYISTILICMGCTSLQRLIAAVRILYYIDLLIHLPDPSTVNGIALGGIVA